MWQIRCSLYSSGMCVCFVVQPMCCFCFCCVDYLFGFRLLSTTYNLNRRRISLRAGGAMGQTMTEGRLLVPLFSRFS